MSENETIAGLAPDRPREAFDTVLRAALQANPVIERGNGIAKALIPDGFKLEDISDPHRLPPYIKQALVVDDADSLIAYVNRFRDARSVLIADIDAVQVCAVLDYHASADDKLAAHPGHHKALLKLRQSEEFARWQDMEGKLHDQMVFAEFLDENASDIVFPEPSVMIEIARDLEAAQGVRFKASTRLQTGERSFSYETETHVKGDLKVPQRFTLSIPLFHGEAPMEIEASFRFRPASDGLKLGFVWRRVEFIRQALFRAIAHRVAEGTGLPVYMGRAV